MSEKVIDQKNLIPVLFDFRNNDSRCPSTLRESSDLCEILAYVLKHNYYSLSPSFRKSIPSYFLDEFRCKCLGLEYWSYQRVVELISDTSKKEPSSKKRKSVRLPDDEENEDGANDSGDDEDDKEKNEDE